MKSDEKKQGTPVTCTVCGQPAWVELKSGRNVISIHADRWGACCGKSGHSVWTRRPTEEEQARLHQTGHPKR